MILELPYPTPSQNQWQRWHWRKRVRWKEQALLAMYAQAGVNELPSPPAKTTGRRRVTITRYSAGTLDQGNFVGGCKGLLDCLVKLGFLVDDSPQWVEDVYIQQKAKRGAGRTVIEVILCP